jgi:hypothetical protein
MALLDIINGYFGPGTIKEKVSLFSDTLAKTASDYGAKAMDTERARQADGSTPPALDGKPIVMQPKPLLTGPTQISQTPTTPALMVSDSSQPTKLGKPSKTPETWKEVIQAEGTTFPAQEGTSGFGFETPPKGVNPITPVSMREDLSPFQKELARQHGSQS